MPEQYQNMKKYKSNFFKGTVYLQIGNFLGISIFRNDPNEISNVKKKSLFWPEVKINRLIDIFSAVFSNQFFPLKRTL